MCDCQNACCDKVPHHHVTHCIFRERRILQGESRLETSFAMDGDLRWQNGEMARSLAGGTGLNASGRRHLTLLGISFSWAYLVEEPPSSAYVG